MVKEEIQEDVPPQVRLDKEAHAIVMKEFLKRMKKSPQPTIRYTHILNELVKRKDTNGKN